MHAMNKALTGVLLLFLAYCSTDKISQDRMSDTSCPNPACGRNKLIKVNFISYSDIVIEYCDGLNGRLGGGQGSHEWRTESRAIRYSFRVGWASSFPTVRQRLRPRDHETTGLRDNRTVLKLDLLATSLVLQGIQRVRLPI